MLEPNRHQIEYLVSTHLIREKSPTFFQTRPRPRPRPRPGPRPRSRPRPRLGPDLGPGLGLDLGPGLGGRPGLVTVTGFAFG